MIVHHHNGVPGGYISLIKMIVSLNREEIINKIFIWKNSSDERAPEKAILWVSSVIFLTGE